MKKIKLKNTYLKDGIYYDIELEKILKSDSQIRLYFSLLSKLKNIYAPNNMTFEEIYNQIDNVNFRLNNSFTFFLDYISRYVGGIVFPVTVNNKTIWVTAKEDLR